MSNVARSLFMFLQPPVQQEIIDIPNCVNTFMSIVPSLLFFTGYIALLCFWAEMYYRSQPNHKSDGTESKRLLQLYIGVNVLMYLFFAIMLSIDLPYAQTSAVRPLMPFLEIATKTFRQTTPTTPSLVHSCRYYGSP